MIEILACAPYLSFVDKHSLLFSNIVVMMMMEK